jgi:hypothetical protein
MHRPRLKPVLTPMAVDPGTISVGFPRTPGSAIIPDPHGGIRAVLDLLDGTRDVEDLTRDLAGHCERADIIKLLQATGHRGLPRGRFAAHPTSRTRNVILALL